MDNSQSNLQFSLTDQIPNPEGTTSFTTSPHASSSYASPANQPNAPYTVFISYANEDIATISIPLRKKLRERGITAFIDSEDVLVGADAISAIDHAMRTATVGVFVMSPEFVARKRPVKELMHFLRRREACITEGIEAPTILPFFYRLAKSDLYDEPRLDRNDMHGNNLYELSRFYQRQQNGEPEASIAGIKATLRKLHSISGIDNLNNVSNDTSYDMYRRREILLNLLCDTIFQAVPELAVQSTPTQHIMHADGHTFRPHFDTPYNISELVFDFDRQDSAGNPSTQEGKILEMLLDTSMDRNRAIAVRGMGGVGKTSLLRKIRSMDRVFERFRDGVYCIEVGRDATRDGLKQALISAVLKSGGKQTAIKMQRETNMEKMMQAFQDWFSQRQCLFLIDDVWNTTEVTREAIRHLWTLHTSGQESKTLLTTRSIDIATYGRACVTLKPREALEDESRAILYHYASLKPDQVKKEDNRVVDEILERCSGLPLLLAVAGSRVKRLSFRRNHKGCMAYHLYANHLKTRVGCMVNTGVGSYEGLSAALANSIDHVEERGQDFGFGVNLSMAEMHRRLSIMKRQMRVPMGMLKHLWELEHDSQAARIAKEFEQVALADVEFERTERGFVEVLRLHNSVYEFAVYETKRCQDEEAGHKAVLEGYAKALPASNNTKREWWSEDLEDDEYIHRNICRHLVGAGFEDELFELLLSLKWLERQVDLNGVRTALRDFSVGIEAALVLKEKTRDREIGEMEEALQMIKEAITMSSSYILKNRTELWFQVHGRLKTAGKSNTIVRGYLAKIENDAPKPGVLCRNELIVERGGANTMIIYVRSPILCMAVKDEEHVVCGCENGEIAIVNVRRSEIEAQWRAHNDSVSAIAVGKEGTLIVSGSWDKTAKVWNAESGECITTFQGHRNIVTCVATTEDGNKVVSGSHDRTVQLWEVTSGQRVGAPMYPNFYIDRLLVLRNGEHIVIGGVHDIVIGARGELEMWNMKTNANASFDGHTNTLLCAELTKDENQLLAGSWDGTVRLWDVQTRQQVGSSFDGHTGWVACIATSDDGRRVVSGSADKTVRIWDIKSTRQVCDPLIGHTAGITGVSYLGEKDTIVSCSFDGTVRVWNSKRTSKAKAIEKHGDYVSSISFTPDGRFVVSGSKDGTLRVWDAISGQAVGQPMENASNIFGVAVTPDSRFFVSVSDDNRVCLWDLQTRDIVRTFQGHTSSVLCVAVTPDGERAVTGCSDRTVRIWNLKSMDQGHAILQGHSADVRRVFVSDDGRRILSVDCVDNVFVWDLETQAEMKRMMKRAAQYMSRRLVLSLAGEATVHDEAGLSLPVYRNEIVHGEGSGALVLGSLETTIYDWDISPDKKAICVGLQDGRVGLLKVRF